MSTRQAVILIDHGSQRASANASLENIARSVSQRLGVSVYPAHMALAEPTLAQALAQAVAEGADRVVVCPYFLSSGRHGAQDIPAMAREAAKEFPQVSVVVSDPLGEDPVLVDLVARRVGPHLQPREKA